MGDITYISKDLVSVKVVKKKKGKFEPTGERMVLAWGDAVEILEHLKSGNKITKTRAKVGSGRSARVFEAKGKLAIQNEGVLQFSMVDVQQGDGMVIETPKGRKLFIDGGDNKLFARYTAARYRGTTSKKPLEVDAMIITHGDADHFSGLSEIAKSESHGTARKKLFIHPKRVYHNGLVKGPSKLPPESIFGRTVSLDPERYAVELEEDLLSVPTDRLNTPFRSWVKALKHWSENGPIEFRRLAFGDKTAFDFIADEGISVRVMGPFKKKIKDGANTVDALPLLRKPPKTVNLHLLDEVDTARAFSASHTINGHSIALQLTMGNVRFFLTGDLNQEAMKILRSKTTNKELESEIIKAPHHGSADFDLRTLKAMSPVVSLISSGDESSRKEHIHPRATLMGALGKVSRSDTPLIFCTELAAFFAVRGMSNSDAGERYFGFKRTNFGIIQIRTDGKRVLVFTHSGDATMKEAYRFTVDGNHKVKFENVRKG